MRLWTLTSPTSLSQRLSFDLKRPGPKANGRRQSNAPLSLQCVPAGVAIEVAVVLLRCAFGIGEPDGCFARGARGDRPGQRVYFTLLCDKREEEADARN